MSLASQISAVASAITGAATGLGKLGASLGISIGGGKGLNTITSTVGKSAGTLGQTTATIGKINNEIIDFQGPSIEITSQIVAITTSIEVITTEIHNFLAGFSVYSTDASTEENLTIQGEKLIYLKSETGDFEEGFYITGIKETIDYSNGYWPMGIVNGNSTASGYNIGRLFTYEDYMDIPEEIRKEAEEIMNGGV